MALLFLIDNVATVRVCVCVCVCVCSVIQFIMWYTSGAVSGSKAGVATEDNPAYGVSGPHGKGDQTEHAYEMPDFIQPPPASPEAVYKGIN